MRRLQFHVEHLTFEHSVVGLRNQLARRPGILDVATDPRASTATITFDPCRCGQRDVERMIEECGYRCRCQTMSAAGARAPSGRIATAPLLGGITARAGGARRDLDEQPARVP